MRKLILFALSIGSVLTAGCGTQITSPTASHTQAAATSLRLSTSTPFSHSAPIEATATISLHRSTATASTTHAAHVDPLDLREPSLQQLNAYLTGTLPDFYAFGFASSIMSIPEDVSGDGKPDWVARDADGTVALALVYQDADGDGDDDLVLYGYDGLVILLWDENAYTRPFYLHSEWGTPAAKYGSAMTVSFQDWTNDALPEVVYDEKAGSGGTGFQVWVVTRSIVRCADRACALSWQGVISVTTDDHNMGGVYRHDVNMRAVLDTQGRPALRLVDSAFRIYCCSDMASSPFPYDSLYVYTSTLSVYLWDGKAFGLTDEQIISRESSVSSNALLVSKNSRGHQASITWAESEYRSNDYCQLSVDGRTISTHFGCRHNFTNLEWRDITGDGEEDIVVTAYSGGAPTGPDGQLSDEACAHQRLLAYQWDGVTATQIANVAGCVIRDDLYGVRLEDYDGDGQAEILAAPLSRYGANHVLSNRAYKWNGTGFVLWSDVPLQ